MVPLSSLIGDANMTGHLVFQVKEQNTWLKLTSRFKIGNDLSPNHSQPLDGQEHLNLVALWVSLDSHHDYYPLQIDA